MEGNLDSLKVDWRDLASIAKFDGVANGDALGDAYDVFEIDATAYSGRGRWKQTQQEL